MPGWAHTKASRERDTERGVYGRSRSSVNRTTLAPKPRANPTEDSAADLVARTPALPQRPPSVPQMAKFTWGEHCDDESAHSINLCPTWRESGTFATTAAR